MTHQIHDLGVARHIGSYSDAIEVEPGARWLFTSGTPGLTETGAIPDGVEAQTRLAWAHIIDALTRARMTTADLVKVTTSLTRADDIPAYVKIRKEVLGEVKPSFMLQVVTQLIRPEVRVEIEIVAARK